MELNLSPQSADATLYDGEGGAYYAWTPAKFPLLSQASLGAGKLVLKPRGLAMPHYADTFKIGYVVQGTCTVGLVSPNSPQEKVVIINEGDAIPVAMGGLSWWFNGGDSDMTIIFLGESKLSYNPGQFDYFFLAGALGAIGGFSDDFVTKIYGFKDAEFSKKITKSQPAALGLKVPEEIKMPGESNCDVKEYIYNLALGLKVPEEIKMPGVSNYIHNLADSIRPGHMTAKKLGHDGSSHVVSAEVTADKLAKLDEIGLSASLVRLGPNSALDPSYSTDGSHRITYVVKGGGRLQIVGLNGTLALDADVQQDQVFVVPRFFAAALVAGEQGIELFSVYTSSRPVMAQLAGNASAWKALSSPVLQASLNVSAADVELFVSKN